MSPILIMSGSLLFVVAGNRYRIAKELPLSVVVSSQLRSINFDVKPYRKCSSISSDFQNATISLLKDNINARPSSDPTCHSAITKKWLVVGDGDFSYSAMIASDLANQNRHLTATVLEEESVHRKVYKRSQMNTETILRACTKIDQDKEGSDTQSSAEQFHNCQVMFGIDATRLQDYFPQADTTKTTNLNFDRIIWNFPHWRGKTNAKYNRQLLDDFFHSATQVLGPTNGEICIALCEGQGGYPSSSLQEWRRSWLLPTYAAEHNLLLRNLEPYTPNYNQTSHRGRDRPWQKDGTAQLYTFTFPNHEAVHESLQLSCRHELRIILDPTKLKISPVSEDEIINGNAVLELAQEFMPEGFDIDVAARILLTQIKSKHFVFPLAVFFLNYSGESVPITRQSADNIRAKIETTVQERWNLDIAKAGRLVSRPYPRHLLPQLIKEYNND